MDRSAPGLRIDKWLWHARLCRTRIVAQHQAAAGLIRLNGRRVERASTRVRPGDVMTLTMGAEVLVVRVVKLGARRGPAPEARALYELIEEQRAA